LNQSIFIQASGIFTFISHRNGRAYKVQTIVAHTEGTFFTFLASKKYSSHDTVLSFKTIRRLHIACWHIDSTLFKVKLVQKTRLEHSNFCYLSKIKINKTDLIKSKYFVSFVKAAWVLCRRNRQKRAVGVTVVTDGEEGPVLRERCLVEGHANLRRYIELRQTSNFRGKGTPKSPTAIEQ
jgi:hypothetical protein